jgi:putative heme-binding domain-containing protein
VAAFLFAFALLAQAPPGPTEGERLFRSQCAHCHGLRGEGGRGAVLAVPTLRHAASDGALARVIRRGIPGTEMPGTAFSDRQIAQVAAFVRSLGRADPRPVPGDPARGRALYESKGKCAGCHTLAGRGRAVGPDLGGIGARTGAAYLRDALLDPEKEVPAGFVQVRAVTRGGTGVLGLRVNEDTFSIQIRDLSGETRSFWKDELAELSKELGGSPMPSYRSTLTAGEIDDLVAYLVSLR